MLHQDVAAKLMNLEIFRGLGRQSVERIARNAEKMMFKPGQTIIRSGDLGNAAFLVIGGEAEMLSEDSSPVPIVAGSLLGELAMLTEHEYRVTVVCRGPVRAMRLSREAIHAEMAAAPDLAEHFVSRISSRLTRVAIELRRVDQLLAMASETAAVAQPA